MRFINLDAHRPSEAWLKKSDELTKQLIELHKKGDIEARNKLIEDNSAHWGEIKEWLLKLSHNKCWFSEARDIFSHMDVEHFRPKREAKQLDGTVRDGYWWLAFDYRNYRVCGNVGNRKKGGWFPLKLGSAISTSEQPCEEMEIPYFLDPTDPYDVKLLAFDEEGKAISAPGILEWDKQRVEVTIERLKLSEHALLSEERRKVWQRMTLEINQYQHFMSRCQAGDNLVAKEKVRAHLKKILEMVMESEELSSVAKWCVWFRHDEMLTNLIT